MSSHAIDTPEEEFTEVSQVNSEPDHSDSEGSLKESAPLVPPPNPLLPKTIKSSEDPLLAFKIPFK